MSQSACSLKPGEPATFANFRSWMGTIQNDRTTGCMSLALPLASTSPPTPVCVDPVTGHIGLCQDIRVGTLSYRIPGEGTTITSLLLGKIQQ